MNYLETIDFDSSYGTSADTIITDFDSPTDLRNFESQYRYNGNIVLLEDGRYDQDWHRHYLDERDYYNDDYVFYGHKHISEFADIFNQQLLDYAKAHGDDDADELRQRLEQYKSALEGLSDDEMIAVELNSIECLRDNIIVVSTYTTDSYVNRHYSLGFRFTRDVEVEQ